MSMTRLAAGLGLSASLGLAPGCDYERDIPDDIVEPDLDKDDEEHDDDPRVETQELAACEFLGADRSCGSEGRGIQFCAWLYNEEADDISTYWGECLAAPECSLWSCRDQDGALCDLVDGKPQWTPEACGW